MARQPEDKAVAKISKDDSALIRELALLLDETSLTEIEIERAGLRVRVARNVSISASMPANFAQGAPALAHRRRIAGTVGGPVAASGCGALAHGRHRLLGARARR